MITTDIKNLLKIYNREMALRRIELRTIPRQGIVLPLDYKAVNELQFEDI